MPNIVFQENNTQRTEQEQSLFNKGMAPEEVALLSDEEILKLMIAERRTKMSVDQSVRTANLRRRSRHVAAPTRK